MKTILFIEVSCPADINVSLKESEKLHKYQPFAKDFHSMYQMNVVIVPIVIGKTGVMSTKSKQFLKNIPDFTVSRGGGAGQRVRGPGQL